jgi:predicted nucleotidyltransferase
MKYGIPEKQLEKVLGTISRESRVEGIVLYGSRAKETFRPGSDIDLCLEVHDLDSHRSYALKTNSTISSFPGRSTSPSGIESMIPISSSISRA